MSEFENDIAKQEMPFPCPFCGSLPDANINEIGVVRIVCVNKLCPTTYLVVEQPTHERAVRMWNTRTDVPPAEGSKT